MAINPYSSRHSLPLIYANLASEMVYIIAQRLDAMPDTNAAHVQRKEVLLSMVNVIFAEEFITKTLLEFEVSPSRSAMKAVFAKLMAYSPLKMRENSFSKMYDLMAVPLKCQVYLCQRPEDILLVTLNHLDGVEDLITVPPFGPADSQVKLIRQTSDVMLKIYKDLTPGQFLVLRQMVLTFFQDMQIRVSVLMREGMQNEDARFIRRGGGQVAPGYEPPGAVRHFGLDGKVCEVSTFNIDYTYSRSASTPVLARHGKRHTTLGRNMYLSWEKRKEAKQLTSAAQSEAHALLAQQQVPEIEGETAATVQAAKAEAKLLRTALGETLPSGVRPAIDLELDLHLVDERSTAAAGKAKQARPIPKQVLDFTQFRDKSYDNIWQDFTFDDKTQESKTSGEELADLMDSVQT